VGPEEAWRHAERLLEDAELAARLTRPDQRRDLTVDRIRTARRALRQAAAASSHWTAYPSLADQGQDVERRSLLKLAALVPALPWDALGALSGPAAVTTGWLAAADEVTATYVRAYHQVPATALADAVDSHVDRLVARLSASLTPSLRRRLTSAVADTAGLAGWLSVDLDRPARARGSFTLARDAAREADNPALLGAALGSLSAVYSPIPRGLRGGDPNAALALMQQATIAATGGPPLLRSWLHARHAEAAALLGDHRAAAHALDQASAALTAADRHTSDGPTRTFSRHGYLANWDAERIEDYRGFSLTLLGRPREAMPALARSLAATPEGSRARLYTATNLARAHAASGQPEQAAALCREALDAALNSGSTIGVERVRGARDLLNAWAREPFVRRLDQQLAQHLTPAR
jgi:tetratricopeptide (TPR) repeat protein